MRILHLVSYAVYSGPAPGVLGLAQAQRRLGAQVWLAHDSWRGTFSPYEETIGPHLQTKEGEPAWAPPCQLHNAAKGGPWRLWQDARRLRAWLQQARIDVVHTHLSHDHTLARLACPAGTALVRTVHAVRNLPRSLFRSWLWRGSDAAVLRVPAHADAFAAAYPTHARPGGMPFACIAGGIDTDFWHTASLQKDRHSVREQTRARLQLPAEAQLLLHVALMADRGQRQLLEALATLPADAPRPHVVFVGRGPKEMEVRQLAQQLQNRVHAHFVGYLQAEALRALYAAADAAFVAQPGNDGAARAALEALSMQLPLLVLPQHGLQQLAQATGGFVASDNSAQGIAAAIGHWQQTAATRAPLSNQGRAHMLAERSFAAEALATQACYRAAIAHAQRR